VAVATILAGLNPASSCPPIRSADFPAEFRLRSERESRTDAHMCQALGLIPYHHDEESHHRKRGRGGGKDEVEY
jgi:hypothetical protein